MNSHRWSKAGAAAALSMLLAAPTGAYELFGGEPASVSPAVEYYNAELGEYFVTVSFNEIVALDAGAAPDWKRTRDYAFYAIEVPASARFAGGLGAASPVCRYFVPPGSHFLSAFEEECTAVGQRIPGAVLETEAAFYAWRPGEDGACRQLYTPIGGFAFAPVYRLWDGAGGTAHRLTASKAERDAMVASGWVSEGYGADGVAMCVPSWGSD